MVSRLEHELVEYGASREQKRLTQPPDAKQKPAGVEGGLPDRRLLGVGDDKQQPTRQGHGKRLHSQVYKSCTKRLEQLHKLHLGIIV